MSLQRFNFAFPEDNDSANLECWGVVLPDGGVACKLKELAVFLGYKDVKKSYKLIPEEWKITWKNLENKLEPLKTHLKMSSDLSSNWHPETLFVTEPGFYALMAESNKPMAKEKVRFVYETILPTIRKTGRFDSAAVPKINNGKDVINYDATKLAAENAELKRQLALNDLKLVEERNDKKQALIEIKYNYESQIAQYKESQLKMQMTIRELSFEANMNLTQLGVSTLLAKDNIEENSNMRASLESVSERVVPSMSNHPNKEEYLTCYDRTVNGKRRIRVTRSQKKEVDQCDKILENQLTNPSKRHRSKRYGWLLDSEKFLQIKCPNPVAVWVIIRAEHPYMFYGLKYVNKLCTEMELLDENELRAKYQSDFEMIERNRVSDKNCIGNFKKLAFVDEDDCVAKCLTPSTDVRARVSKIVQSVIDITKKEILPEGNPKTYDNASDLYSPERVIDFIKNKGVHHVNYNFNNNLQFSYNYTAVCNKEKEDEYNVN